MAQTAAQVVPGYLTTVGCPGGLTACFVPSSPSTALAGTQTAVSLAAATALTVPTGATLAIITVEGTNNAGGICARWRDDGTDPDATTGMTLVAGADFLYTGDFSAIKFIETAASAKLNVSYYK